LSQGTLIAGGILLAFIVYVTVQGHLGAYLGDLGI